MRTILSIIKKTTLCSAVFVLSSFSLAGPSSAFADDVPCTAPANNQNGVHWPVGADAGTFTYQCDGPYAGFWTNAYYKYDPATAQRYALYDPAYSYDCGSGTWSMTEWDYSPSAGTFVQSRVKPSVAPNLATGCPVPVTSTPTSTDPTTAANTDASNAVAINNTGPGSTNSTNGTITLNGTNTNNNTLTMSNGIFSNAATGNTFVIGNTTGGDAASGNALSLANIANLLQSTSNVFGPNTTTFVSNINGDVNGDFMFDPSAVISSTGPGSTNTTTGSLQVNTNNTNNTNAQINNNVNLGAASGSATVASNTSGGNATSGTATAIANLMNLINSTVAAGKSFVGVVNINGNLNGDILLPQSFIDQLLASSGPGSTNTLNSTVTNNSTTTNNTTEGVANNITSTAQSGNATVASNTTGGSATSGSAGTNVTLLNLTGSNVVGSNDILVFVNVLGHWIGMIVNAPAGSTAAELGGGITSSGPNSNNSANNSLTNNSTTTNNANLGILNNVNVHANSGDATVTNNTTGGNATSGRANTAVNLLNIAGSNLSLSNWFGVLFINVFGNWTGSFGVNTSAGDPVSTGSTTSTAQSASSSATPSPAVAGSFKQFAHFFSQSSSNGSDNTTSQAPETTASVLGSSVAKKVTSTSANLPTADNGTHTSYLLPIVGGSIAFLLLLASERDRFTHRK